MQTRKGACCTMVSPSAAEHIWSCTVSAGVSGESPKSKASSSLLFWNLSSLAYKSKNKRSTTCPSLKCFYTCQKHFTLQWKNVSFISTCRKEAFQMPERWASGTKAQVLTFGDRNHRNETASYSKRMQNELLQQLLREQTQTDSITFLLEVF